jgi:hypothetical protein
MMGHPAQGAVLVVTHPIRPARSTGSPDRSSQPESGYNPETPATLLIASVADLETKFALGFYTAELLPSKTNDGWFCVVQPKHSREIVAIDHFLSYDEARNAVTKTLEHLHRAIASGE